MSTIRETVLSICQQARSAAAELRTLSGQVRSDALAAMPAALEASREAVQEANDADLEDARQRLPSKTSSKQGIRSSPTCRAG